MLAFQLTLGKLGELRRKAIGLNSESGRFWTNAMLLVGEPLPPFCTLRGDTAVCALVRRLTQLLISLTVCAVMVLIDHVMMGREERAQTIRTT